MLKYLNPSVKIVPITVGLAKYEECLKVAERITEILNKTKDKVLIVVSSDMNHYEDSETTLKKIILL